MSDPKVGDLRIWNTEFKFEENEGAFKILSIEYRKRTAWANYTFLKSGREDVDLVSFIKSNSFLSPTSLLKSEFDNE